MGGGVIFFTMNPNLKGGEGEGVYYESKFKIIFFAGAGGGGGGGGGGVEGG